jgi:hypothetical protein
MSHRFGSRAPEPGLARYAGSARGDGPRGAAPEAGEVAAGPQAQVVWRWITSQGLFSGTM